MPLREVLFGASVDTVVPATRVVGPTLATFLHTVETVSGNRLRRRRLRPHITKGTRESVIEDVPIARIVGVTGVGHLQDFIYGMTFRQVLFTSLHGASLTASSLDYFLSDSLKGDNHQRLPGSTEMPQDDRCIGKERARGGITLPKRGDYYFNDHGKQRSSMAMFWMFQNRGERGTLNKVTVERRVA